MDSLLEKLGETKETPATEGKAESKPDDAPSPDRKLDDAAAKKLDERQKKTDAELERLTGRVTKQDREKQRDAEQKDSSQIGQAVKKCAKSRNVSANPILARKRGRSRAKL